MALERTWHPEKPLQDAAIGWLKTEREPYGEYFDDSEAVGERMDSAGLIGDRNFVIEVKVSISANIVEHADNRPGSLESKVSGALRDIYARKAGRLAESVNQHWNRERPLVLVFLAQSVTRDALDALSKMIEYRSHDWKFDFRLWLWHGGKIVEKLRKDLPNAPRPQSYEQLEIPIQIGRKPRAPARTLAEFREIAVTLQIGHLFDAIVDEAKQFSAPIKHYRHGFSIRRRRPDRSGHIDAISVYLDPEKTPIGALWVGCAAMEFGVDLPKLPGRPAPYGGHQHANLYLSTTDEVRALVRLLAP